MTKRKRLLFEDGHPDESKDSSQDESPWADGVIPMYHGLHDQLLDLPKVIPFRQGGMLTGLSLSPVPGGWRAIVKRRYRSGHEVSFLEADTWVGLLAAVCECAEKGAFTWFEDRYPPR